MRWIFAAWFTMGSMHTVKKSQYMITVTGRSPVIAAPTERPVKPVSEIGVCQVRLSWNWSQSSLRSLTGPMSSPIWKTRSSRAISSFRASLIACVYVISSISVILRAG